MPLLSFLLHTWAFQFRASRCFRGTLRSRFISRQPRPHLRVPRPRQVIVELPAGSRGKDITCAFNTQVRNDVFDPGV